MLSPYYEKLKIKTEEAREDIRNGTGYYAGIACEEDDGTEGKPRKKRKAGKCKCGSTTHSRTNHRACPLNSANQRMSADLLFVMEQDSNNQELLDQLGSHDEMVAQRLGYLMDRQNQCDHENSKKEDTNEEDTNDENEEETSTNVI